MTDAQRARIVQVLWPQAPGPARSVWALLDGARDPAVYRLLLESRLEFLSLYRQPVAAALERVSPQMVELLPGHRFVDRLLDAAWGRSWGIFVTIDDASNLRHHLRKLLKVRDPAGRTLLFRYYDPRVLRTYLPTCRVDELEQVFGPIDAIVAEAEGGTAALRYTFDGLRLQMRMHPVREVEAAADARP